MRITLICATINLFSITCMSLLSSSALAQSQPIDWSLADTTINADGTYTGSVGSTTWTLVISGADAVSVQPEDGEFLRGIIGGNNTATYELSFDQPVLITWFDDFFEPGIGGLASTEFVDIMGGVGNFDLIDNSANITGLAGVGSFPPVLSVENGTDLRASFNLISEHAYYLANSIGWQTALTWAHTSGATKIEGWRVDVAQCQAVDWSTVAGNGSYAGNVGSVGWSLTISGADSAIPDPGDSTLLRSTIGGPSKSAIYSLEFDRPAYFAWWNGTAGVVGGLAGLDLLSNEFVDLLGADGVLDFFDNSANIPPLSGDSSVSPVFSTVGSDLRAESSPGVDHAYYLARTPFPETSLTWTHNNNVPKAEVWRLCVVPATVPPVPALSNPGRILLLLAGLGASTWWLALRRRAS